MGVGKIGFQGVMDMLEWVGKAGSCHVSRVTGRTRRTPCPHC